MRRQILPQTELCVSPICLGTGQYGTGIDASTALSQLSEFYELGGNFIDTAHIYGNWGEGLESPSEKLIGTWLKSTGLRSSVIISTKGAHPKLESMHISRMGIPELSLDLEESLQFLQTDYIDLYFLHRDDPTIPVEIIIDYLDSCVEAGKIRYYGCSNWQLSRIKEAAAYVKSKGTQGFVVNQTMLSLADVNYHNMPDASLVPMDKTMYAYHKNQRISVMAYMALAKGYFEKKASGQTLPELVSRLYENPTNTRIYQKVEECVRNGEYSYIDISFLFLMHENAFPIIPVTAFSSSTQLQSAVRSCDKHISEEFYRELLHIKNYVYGE